MQDCKHNFFIPRRYINQAFRFEKEKRKFQIKDERKLYKKGINSNRLTRQNILMLTYSLICNI